MWSVLTMGEWGLYLNTVLVNPLESPVSVKSETKKLRLISLPLQPQSTGKRALGLQTINVISKSCQPLQKYESRVRHLFVLA